MRKNLLITLFSPGIWLLAACTLFSSTEHDLAITEGILAGVTDSASAREAARKLSQGSEVSTLFRTLSCDSRRFKVDNQLERLKKNYYFESPELARVLGANETAAIIPSPIPADKLAALRKFARQRLDAHLTPAERRQISGGPGFTQATAWVLAAGADDLGTEIALRTILDDTGYTWREEIIGQQRYGVYTITQVTGGKKHLLEQWVNTTASRKVHPEAERKAAMQELEERHREAYPLLMSIHDEASAQAVLEELGHLLNAQECARLSRIAETNLTLYGFMSRILTPAQLKVYVTHEATIIKAGYYGSQELEDLIGEIPIWHSAH